jgi:hypothetical protein
MITLYRDVFGLDRAKEIWDSIFKYYSQELAYYGQYQGTPKADGVRNATQDACQIIYTLHYTASVDLNDSARAEKAQALLAEQGYQIK